MVIRTNCPVCGDVSVRPKDIRMELVGGGGDNGARYAFSCPVCARTAAGHAEPAATRTLRAAGAVCVVELRPDAALPALTYDNLLDFCTQELASDYVVETMHRAVGASSHPAWSQTSVQDRRTADEG